MPRRCSLLTPTARRLQYELIRELADAAVSNQLTLNQAQAGLSAVMADIWNSTEGMILSKLPEDDANPLVDLKRGERELANRSRDHRV
jgi:hypothetical protein